jgi:hypothetical protein
MNRMHKLLLFAFLPILGCASRMSNFSPILLNLEPSTECYNALDSSAISYNTYSVFPKSAIDSTTLLSNPILEQQMLFFVRNLFEGKGYKFVKRIQILIFLSQSMAQ